MATANFQDNKVLFAANLLAAFANVVSISGDTMTGPLAVPSISTTSTSQMDGGITTIGPVILTNARLTVATLNIFSTLVNSFGTANVAKTLGQAAFDSGNNTLVLAQAAFDFANNINVSGSGGSTSQQTFLTSNGIIANGTVNLTVVGNNTVILSANGANTTQVGVVQLNDTFVSSSITQAATANVGKNIFNVATGAFTQANNVNTFAGSGFNVANSALNLSQSAFSVANAALGAGKVSKAGDTMTGALTITAPGTSLTSSNNVSFPGTLTLTGIDVGTGLTQAKTNANSALNLAQSGYARANVSELNQSTYFTANGLTVNSGTSLVVSGNTTAFFSANIGNTTQAGIVQLNDTVTSTSVTLGATANAVNTVWSTAVAAFAKANIAPPVSGTTQLTFLSSNSITVNSGTSLTVVGNNTILLSANTGNTTQPGIVQLNDTVFGTFTGQAATANAVTTAFNTGAAAFTKANTTVVRAGDAMTGTLTVPNLTVNTAINTTTVTANGNVVAANIVTSGVVNSAILMVQPIASNANFILRPDHSGQVITFSHTGVALINVNNTLSVGFRTILTQINTGNVKVQAGANVTINPTSGSNNQISIKFGSVSLFCYAPNTFILDGSLQ